MVTTKTAKPEIPGVILCFRHWQIADYEIDLETSGSGSTVVVQGFEGSSTNLIHMSVIALGYCVIRQ